MSGRLLREKNRKSVRKPVYRTLKDMKPEKEFNPLEKLKVWQLAIDFSVDYHNVIVSISDFGLRDQMTRSSLSVSSNIAEGFGRKYDKEFVRFLKIAIGSLYEIQSQFVFAKRIGAIDVDLDEVNFRICEIRRRIYSLISHLESKTK